MTSDQDPAALDLVSDPAGMHDEDGNVAGFPRHWDFDEVYDSFDRGCGDFIIDLRQVMAGLAPGTTLMIASRDAGAPVEIPAWCRLTGHTLLEAAPPFYLVRKREAEYR